MAEQSTAKLTGRYQSNAFEAGKRAWLFLNNLTPVQSLRNWRLHPLIATFGSEEDYTTCRGGQKGA